MIKTILPLNPVIIDSHGRRRFRANKIVDYIVSSGLVSLNDIARKGFPREDQEQFATLHGYSVSAFTGLDFVSAGRAEEARAMEKVCLSSGNDGWEGQLLNSPSGLRLYVMSLENHLGELEAKHAEMRDILGENGEQ